MRRGTPVVLMALALLAVLIRIAALPLHAQSATPLAGADQALLREVRAVRAIDNHAHVMRPVPDDTEYDALPFTLLDAPPAGTMPGPAPTRPENPLYAKAKAAMKGKTTPASVLDLQGIDVALANRVAMAPDLPSARFKWVPFADPLIFPLDNSVAKAANRDYHAFYPAEEALLKRYLQESGVRELPPTLDEYCRRVVTATLERHRAAGAVAEKLEAAYLRWLDFGPADEADAAAIYARYARGGVPPAAEYKRLQDYLFAHVAREAGRVGMAIHIHVANGGGFNYDQRGSNPLLLTWAFNEPSLRRTTFVIVHGGYPYYRETAGLISKPNVYADFSALSFFEGVQGQAALLRMWLSVWPEKVLFGSDATPMGDGIGWEEVGWAASHTAREALAIALTGMIRDGEISRPRASALARMVLRDNAKQLYGF
jgi:predicted TIM-barrel fold metal-dependent hydrolase